jgi:hypothetical protein
MYQNKKAKILSVRYQRHSSRQGDISELKAWKSAWPCCTPEPHDPVYIHRPQKHLQQGQRLFPHIADPHSWSASAFVLDYNLLSIRYHIWQIESFSIVPGQWISVPRNALKLWNSAAILPWLRYMPASNESAPGVYPVTGLEIERRQNQEFSPSYYEPLSSHRLRAMKNFKISRFFGTDTNRRRSSGLQQIWYHHTDSSVHSSGDYKKS